MTNKSGVSSQIITLPQGGGAMQGIGATFSPELYTGTGNFSVPIALPSGRAGLQPTLNLVYSTGSGNDVFGVGWQHSIPCVMRKTSQGIPRYVDTNDTFVLSNTEDLVPVERTDAVTRYRPRTEGLFARIEHHHSAEQNRWRIWTKDGLINDYDTIIADPQQPDNIFTWKLSRTQDPFGNQIEYVYERDRQQEGVRAWDQLYLHQIRYADVSDDAAARFLVSVTFEYEDRPDPFSNYRAGFEIRTRRRCHTLRVETHAEQTELVRTYRFIYLDQRTDLDSLDGRLPYNGASLLSQLRVTGHDGDAQEALPALTFGYSHFEPLGRNLIPITGQALPTQSLASPTLELADLFGNGLPDIIEMNGSVRYWRNLGNGHFDLPRPMSTAPAGITLADAGVQLIDANGNGHVDLLVTQPNLAGYYPLHSGGVWDRRSFQKYTVAPTVHLEDPNVQLVDLTGDGITDAVHSGRRLTCFFNDPHLGWHETRQVERHNIPSQINFSDPRVKWGDMSGDGLQDIVLIHDGNIDYWPNHGYGNWGERISMANSPRYPHGYDPQRLLIGDVDGDGVDDLVYVDHCRVTVWINQSGNGWSAPIEINGTPPMSNVDAVRLVDLLGTGIHGILWSADTRQFGRAAYHFLDLTGGVKPYLLTEMDNRMGSITRIGYRSSIDYYLEDEQTSQTRWKTNLPFPVQVVSRVETIDHISQGKLTTEYSYHHGYWDGAEREFRGFGRVEQYDTEQFATHNAFGLHGDAVAFNHVSDPEQFSPPLHTKTWFHQGPIGDEFGTWEEVDYSDEYWPDDPQQLERPPAMTDLLNTLPRRARRDALRTWRGQLLRSELYAQDGSPQQDRPYTVTESVNGVREIAPSADSSRLRIFFPHNLAQRTTQWERGAEPMTQVAFTSDYDAYGQPRLQAAIAVPRGRDFRVEMSSAEPYLATQTLTTYAQRDDAACYIVNRPAQTGQYEIHNDGTSPLLDLWQQIEAGDVAREQIGQSLHYYDGAAFVGLPLGQLGDFGALVRTEVLALTEAELQTAHPDGVPSYLVPNTPVAWDAVYPQTFRDQMPSLAGYTFQAGDDVHARGYFVTATQQQYDFQTSGTGRGLLQATRDPLGREVTITYDAFDLLPTHVVDPIGMTTVAVYDYRVMQPRFVVDPNGNRQVYAYTPLGLLARAAVMGKVDEAVGDTLDAPGTQLAYDWLAFETRQQPVSVRSIRREHHVNDLHIMRPQRNEMIETIEYSDGFGRLLQTRTQAERLVFGNTPFGNEVGLPADQAVLVTDAIGHEQPIDAPPRVVVNGWQRYDNKGRIVEKYEPFYAVGWAFELPSESELGQHTTVFYDPRGQVIRTVNPDGSEQRVIFGIPLALDTPDQFMPTAWETYTYDANDNAGRTHVATSADFSTHWNTPANATLDALGRTVETVERNGSDPDNDWYITRTTYDIRGNVLTVTDALGRVAFRYTYDLANQPLRTESIDAGVQHVVLDALGNVVEQRDSKGAMLLQTYDALNRPKQIWGRDAQDLSIGLRQRLFYGDEQDHATARINNLLGQIVQHDDEAGQVTISGYDFKGNPLEKQRRVIGDAAFEAVFAAAEQNSWQVETFRVDWEAVSADILAPTPYVTTMTYDALNRLVEMHYPEDVTGTRQILRPDYNRAGSLQRVTLNDEPFVEQIAYNAKGQRTLIALGNGIMTRYAYDAATFRLARLRSERYVQADNRFQPSGAPLQDFAYQYDLIGNVTTIRDSTPDSGILNTPLGADQLERQFRYDPIYRLLTATGRECDQPPNALPNSPQLRCTDTTRSRPYRQQYTYDPLGNMLQLRHEHILTTGAVQAHNRMFALVSDGSDTPSSNRLATVTAGQATFAYRYDASGNTLQEGVARHFAWTGGNQLKAFRAQVTGSEPSVYAHYVYDAMGQRVMKWVRRQGGTVNVTVYIDGIFEHHRRITLGSVQQNNTLHVMDNQSRVALVRAGAAFSDDSAPAVQYQLGDHLGSSNVITSTTGALVSREEFTPYGETSFGSFTHKRYRFTGKERDEESGLNYHGLRYLNLMACRWVNPDLLGPIDAISLYQYVNSNPINWLDETGANSTEPNESKSGTDDNLSERNALFVRVGGQNLGEADDKLIAKLEKSGFSISTVNGRTSDQVLIKKVKEADLIFITGHHYVEAGGNPFDFRSHNGSNSNINVDFSELAKRVKGPLSTETKAIVVTGCNTLKPRSLRFIAKEFPNATVAGWANPSPKKDQWMIWGEMAERFDFSKAHDIEDIGFAVRSAFIGAVRDIESKYSDSNKIIAYRKNNKGARVGITEQATYRKLMLARPAVYIPKVAGKGGFLFIHYFDQEKKRMNFRVKHTNLNGPIGQSIGCSCGR